MNHSVQIRGQIHSQQQDSIDYCSLDIWKIGRLLFFLDLWKIGLVY